MNKVTVSSPGKLMLFGEHAVVYNRPCIVTAVDERLFVTVQKTKSGKFELDAPDVQVLNYKKPLSQIGKGEIPKGAKFIEIALKNFLKSNKIPVQARNDSFEGLKITTKSEFSSKFGFGSSSASTVCAIKALSEVYGLKLSQKSIFDISYRTVLDVQGKGSGFDIAASVFGGTLYFFTGGKIIKSLKVPKFPLVVGYSGIKADTVTLIDEVLEKSKRHPKIINGIYDLIEELVKKAKVSIDKSDFQPLGELMDLNQGLLESLGVGSNKLSQMIYGARENGAFGAKLSGAGRGDCIIALVSEKNKKQVCEGIEKAGGEIIEISTNAKGVRIEK